MSDQGGSMTEHRQRTLDALRSAALVSALLMLGLGLVGSIDLTDHVTVAIVWASAAVLWFLWELCVEPLMDRVLQRWLARYKDSHS